jgi:hypothetical protein
MNDMEKNVEKKDQEAKIEAAIGAARFVKIRPPPGASAYEAREAGWHILVIAFGHGARGYDGSAARELPLAAEEAILRNPPKPKLCVVRLPTELAKRAVELAERQVLS